MKEIGGSNAVPAGLTDSAKKKLKKAAAELKAAGANALVVAGSNDVNVQLVVNAINEKLGSYGTTVDIDNALNIRKGNDTDFAALAVSTRTTPIPCVPSRIFKTHGVGPSNLLISFVSVLAAKTVFGISTPCFERI